MLAEAWPDAEIVLLDANERRTAFLADAVDRLGLGRSVSVVRARAEDAGRNPALRGRADLVVARGFGPPSVTAECAAPLLTVGGQLVVSEPPDDTDRWPPRPLAELGLVPVRRVEAPGRYVVLRQAAMCPDRYPRRVGVPAKRPLF